MTAKALLVSHGDPDAFARSLARQLRVWLLLIPGGVGLATLRACLRLCFGRSPAHSGVYSAGNGPAMRSALLGVCYGQDEMRLKALVRASTRITHTDPKAEYGALAIACAAWISVSEAAMGVSSASYEAAGITNAPSPVAAGFVDHACVAIAEILPVEAEEFMTLLERVRRSVQDGQTTQAFATQMGWEQGVGGYVYHTVPVVLHAWLRHPQDYANAVLEVIGCGGDTDTTAAIVGAIVGAAVGKAGIRKSWRTELWEWPRTNARLEQIGIALADERTSGHTRNVPRLNPFALLARNLLFIVVVFAHGFRRLLPPY